MLVNLLKAIKESEPTDKVGGRAGKRYNLMPQMGAANHMGPCGNCRKHMLYLVTNTRG